MCTSQLPVSEIFVQFAGWQEFTYMENAIFLQVFTVQRRLQIDVEKCKEVQGRQLKLISGFIDIDYEKNSEKVALP